MLTNVHVRLFGSVMHLLAELYSQPEVVSRAVVEKPLLLDLNETMDDLSGANALAGRPEDDPFLLSTLAPRLWPFMRHNISSVRLAAIRTLVWHITSFALHRLISTTFSRIGGS